MAAPPSLSQTGGHHQHQHQPGGVALKAPTGSGIELKVWFSSFSCRECGGCS